MLLDFYWKTKSVHIRNNFKLQSVFTHNTVTGWVFIHILVLCRVGFQQFSDLFKVRSLFRDLKSRGHRESVFIVSAVVGVA